MYWEANQFNKTGSFQPKEIGSQKNRVEGGYCTKISSSKLQLFTFVDWLILLLFSILHKWPFQQFETIFIHMYCINNIKFSFSEKATKIWRDLPQEFDVTKLCQNLEGDCAKVLCSSQKSWTLPKLCRYVIDTYLCNYLFMPYIHRGSSQTMFTRGGG